MVPSDGWICHNFQDEVWAVCDYQVEHRGFDVEIDTIKETVYISHLDPKAAIEIENKISDFMMEEKQKYGKKDNQYNYCYLFICVKC